MSIDHAVLREGRPPRASLVFATLVNAYELKKMPLFLVNGRRARLLHLQQLNRRLPFHEIPDMKRDIWHIVEGRARID
jgi:hypothetical protein